jgi:hypothetical protein
LGFNDGGDDDYDDSIGGGRGGIEGGELRRLLRLVSDKGLRVLSLDELGLLREMLEAKDYAGNKKADKSKKKLLKQINAELYNRHSGRRFPFL